jgi:hypothetical protein
MNRDQRRTRCFACSALTATVLFACFALTGTASAASSTSSSHATVYSAAHAQYGNPKVLKPAVGGSVAPSGTKPASVSAAHTPPLTNTRTAGALPFTGISLLIVLFVGLGMLALGVILRRQSSRSSDR